MIHPKNKHLLVKVERKTTNQYGIHVPHDLQFQERGKVLEISKDVSVAKKNDIIYFKSYSAIPMKVDGAEIHFVKEEEVLGIET